MALDFQCQFWVNAAREDRVARTKSIENLKDPATGRSLSPGVEYAEDRGHIPAIMSDPIGALLLSN